MDQIFLTKLLISFLVGGCWVVMATVLADMFGPKFGGLIAGLPSTVMFGLFFLAWTQTPAAAVQATTIIPMIGGINSIFLLIYVILVKKNVWLALFSSFFVWTLCSFLLVFFHFNNLAMALIVYLVLLVTSFYLMEHKLQVQTVRGKKIVYTPMVIILRALVSGFIVAMTVYIAKIGGPILGGMSAAFPAMFTSTMLVTYFAHGAEFSAATVKSSLIGSVSVIVYALIVRYAYVPLGIVLGTLMAIFVSFATGFLIYKTIIHHTK
jgi:hypothetical protein